MFQKLLESGGFHLKCPLVPRGFSSIHTQQLLHWQAVADSPVVHLFAESLAQVSDNALVMYRLHVAAYCNLLLSSSFECSWRPNQITIQCQKQPEREPHRGLRKECVSGADGRAMNEPERQ